MTCAVSANLRRPVAILVRGVATEAPGGMHVVAAADVNHDKKQQGHDADHDSGHLHPTWRARVGEWVRQVSLLLLARSCKHGREVRNETVCPESCQRTARCECPLRDNPLDLSGNSVEMAKTPIDRRVARTKAMLQKAHISLILEKG